MLPSDAKERKAIPVYSGFVCYFPDAIAEVAKVSKRGNDQHNPGKPLHWDRSKSSDELDALMRHVLDSTDDGQSLDRKIEEAAARTWRSLADLQKLCEQNSKIQKSAQPDASLDKFRQVADRVGEPEMVDFSNMHPQGRTYREPQCES